MRPVSRWGNAVRAAFGKACTYNIVGGLEGQGRTDLAPKVIALDTDGIAALNQLGFEMGKHCLMHALQIQVPGCPVAGRHNRYTRIYQGLENPCGNALVISILCLTGRLSLSCSRATRCDVRQYAQKVK